MKTLWHGRKPRAFSLVEMLVVIAIIAILAALLLPALSRGKQRAQRIQCISNLQEIGTAFQMFSHDHGGKFPMQLPQSEGGSEEFVTAGLNISGTFYFSYRHLQPLANELTTPRVLVCPADVDRDQAQNFNYLQNSNVSFFVNVAADYNEPASVLAGDRNITNDAAATASLVRGPYGLRWTRELHFLKGNILFSDTHVEQMNNETMQLPGLTIATGTFFLPAVPTSTIVPGTGPSGGGSGPISAQNPPPPTPPSGPSSPPMNSPPPSGAPAMLANAPVPQQSPSAPQMAGATSGSRMTRHERISTASLIVANARETNAAVVTNDIVAVAPSDIEEGQPPLLWLQGAAGTVFEKGKWWLLLLLLGVVAYFYVRRKVRKWLNRRA